MDKDNLADMCDEVASDWLRVWEVGREATKCVGGPSEDEVERSLDKAFLWHDAAESLRRG
jgi:hypothetical protein